MAIRLRSFLRYYANDDILKVLVLGSPLQKLRYKELINTVSIQMISIHLSLESFVISSCF